MQIGDKIIPPFHGEPRQNDQPTSSIEEAAKEFKTASAGMAYSQYLSNIYLLWRVFDTCNRELNIYCYYC